MPPAERHADRDAFSLRLQQFFHRHAVAGRPFLVLVLRNDQARGLDLKPLGTCIVPMLDDDDDYLLHGERLVVVLAGQQTEDAHRFFARLKQRLRHQMPDQADAYLHRVTAVVLANGGRFQSAEELLSIILEEV